MNPTLPTRIEQILKDVDQDADMGLTVRGIIAQTLSESSTNQQAHGQAELQAIAARTFRIWDSIPEMVRITSIIVSHLSDADTALRRAGWFLNCLTADVPTAEQAADPNWFPYRSQIWKSIRQDEEVGLNPGAIDTLRMLAQGHCTLITRDVLPQPPECLRSLLAAYPLEQLPTVCESIDMGPARVTPWITEALMAAKQHLMTVGRHLLLMESFRLYRPLGMDDFPHYAQHCGLSHQSALSLINFYRYHTDFGDVVTGSVVVTQS